MEEKIWKKGPKYSNNLPLTGNLLCELIFHVTEANPFILNFFFNS